MKSAGLSRPLRRRILRNKVREARDLALKRLLEQKRPDGSWKSTFDVSAFLPAIYIIMLRATGLIEKPGELGTEARLVRHMITQVNPDGGFHKYPGSTSSIRITRLVLTVLEMVLGERTPENRPENNPFPNIEMGQDLENKVRKAARKAAYFLKAKKKDVWRKLDLDFWLPESLLSAYLDRRKVFLLPPLLVPEIVAWAFRSQRVSEFLSHMTLLLYRVLPVVSLLTSKIQERNRFTARLTAFRKMSDFIFRRYQKSMDELIIRILSWQNESGAWLYNASYTVFSILALYEAGMPLSSPSVVKAREYLKNCLFSTADGGMTINLMDVDIWDTCMAVLSYLMVPGRSACDEAILPSVEFLLGSQHERGCYAWDSSSENDPDSDSTAFAVRALAVASRTADEATRKKTEEAVRKGVEWLLLRQDKRGGFSAYRNTFVKYRRRPAGLLKYYFFDVAFPDVTARILHGLVEAGLGPEDKTVQKCLSFLLRTQCRNGAWWSRWWAGYISGTDFVLDVFSRMGLRWGPNPFRAGTLMAQVHEAMRRGIRFVLSCQNEDGGWGETTLADFHPRYSGKGKSRPLQTSSTLFDLLTCGYPSEAEEIRKGYDFLLRAMKQGGCWEDDQVNFTIFPKTFYYRYPFMNSIIPLNSLTAYLIATERKMKE